MGVIETRLNAAHAAAWMAAVGAACLTGARLEWAARWGDPASDSHDATAVLHDTTAENVIDAAMGEASRWVRSPLAHAAAPKTMGDLIDLAEQLEGADLRILPRLVRFRRWRMEPVKRRRTGVWTLDGEPPSLLQAPLLFGNGRAKPLPMSLQLAREVTADDVADALVAVPPVTHARTGLRWVNHSGVSWLAWCALPWTPQPVPWGDPRWAEHRVRFPGWTGAVDPGGIRLLGRHSTLRSLVPGPQAAVTGDAPGNLTGWWYHGIEATHPGDYKFLNWTGLGRWHPTER